MEMTQITLFFPSTPFEAQIGFYRDTLGIALGVQAEGYAL